MFSLLSEVLEPQTQKILILRPNYPPESTSLFLVTILKVLLW